jgi:hypothetical protein
MRKLRLFAGVLSVSQRILKTIMKSGTEYASAYLTTVKTPEGALTLSILQSRKPLK